MPEQLNLRRARVKNSFVISVACHDNGTSLQNTEYSTDFSLFTVVVMKCVRFTYYNFMGRSSSKNHFKAGSYKKTQHISSTILCVA
jgi:hypothetical protein